MFKIKKINFFKVSILIDFVRQTAFHVNFNKKIGKKIAKNT